MSFLGRDHREWEDRTLHLPWECHWAQLHCTYNITEPIVVPYAHRHGNAVIFQDDNARAHHARVVQKHLQFHGIETLPWPVRSPNQSPVEHLWDSLRRCVQRQPHRPQDINELADALQKEWRQIPPSNHWAPYQEHEVSVSRMPGGEWGPYLLLRLL